MNQITINKNDKTVSPDLKNIFGNIQKLELTVTSITLLSVNERIQKLSKSRFLL